MLINHNKNNYNLSFQSRIRLVNSEEYKSIALRISQNKIVTSPWTINESVLADSVKTDMILDCSVLGLRDGRSVFMTHICPTRSENADFAKIVDFIKSKVNLKDKNLQGFLLGSKPQIYVDDVRSTNLFDNFMCFLNEHKIPFSYFKGGNHVNPHDVAYRSVADEWLISNEFITKGSNNISPDEFIKEVKMFDDFNISKLDKLTW